MDVCKFPQEVLFSILGFLDESCLNFRNLCLTNRRMNNAIKEYFKMRWTKVVDQPWRFLVLMQQQNKGCFLTIKSEKEWKKSPSAGGFAVRFLDGKYQAGIWGKNGRRSDKKRISFRKSAHETSPSPSGFLKTSIESLPRDVVFIIFDLVHPFPSFNTFCLLSKRMNVLIKEYYKRQLENLVDGPATNIFLMKQSA
eukprot:TRINITY_DN9710_c0_g2_i1.p1 TRINITY_DN9710_c0_g2~~TRINITY_DN9710_c0_g2_i1.p1  ORF type:complete len:196 (+),score=38.34 TRINITY_DN9710_c0_g2_i1:55-642(+)